MPTFKCTWFFDGVQANSGATMPSYVGWTETWYASRYESIEACLAAMRSTALGSWVNLRTAFLAGNYVVRWCRASDVANPRFTKTCGFTTAAPGLAPLVGTRLNLTNLTGAQVNCCAMVDFYVPPSPSPGPSHHRRALFRGLPVDLINQNVINESSVFFQRMLTFCDYLGVIRAPGSAGTPSPNGWLIRVNNYATPFTSITNLVAGAPGANQVTLTAPLGPLNAGQKVTIRKVPFPTGVNRIWTVISTGIAGIPPYVLGTSRNQLAGTWTQGGQAWANSYNYQAATQYVPVGLRDRRTGRPFNLTRGRRSRR